MRRTFTDSLAIVYPLDYCYSNPDCKQNLFVRRGAVFTNENNESEHWDYINLHGFGHRELPEVMLSPDEMKKLRNWLNQMYPP